MTRGGVGFGAIVLDCPDPHALAAFYGALLDRSVTADSDDDWVDLDGSPVISFQRVGTHRPPAWPDGAPQQLHLDLRVDDFGPTHARVIELGASPLDPAGPPSARDARTFRVYADPAGHPFCLCMC